MTRRRIFINYRRDDSRADSGRLYDRLLSRFPNAVFRDVGSLQPGVQWDVAITTVVSEVNVCIVVIGRDWLDIRDAAGNRRLDNPDDPVRREISIALQHNAKMFPVLVGGAKMPEKEDLPIDLRPLCGWNALEITEQEWDDCYRKLVRAIEGALGLPPRKLAGDGDQRSSRKPIIVGGTALGVLALIGIMLANQRRAGGSNGSVEPQRTVVGPIPADAREDKGRVKADPAADTSDYKKSQQEPQPRISQDNQTKDATDQSDLAAAPTPSSEMASPIGQWQAVIASQAGSLQEDVELFPDHSFRVLLRGGPAAVGTWQIDATGTFIEFVHSTNLLNNSIKFSCRFQANGSVAGAFSGSCVDQMQNPAMVSMRRVSDVPEAVPEIPRIDVSSLSLGERAIFGQLMANRRCTCPCGLTVSVCLKNDPTCPYSPNIARTALMAFLAMTRS